MAGKSYKYEHVRCSIPDAVANAYSEFAALAEECEEVMDSIPESLQGGDRYATFESTKDAIQSHDEPEFPAAVLGPWKPAPAVCASVDFSGFEAWAFFPQFGDADLGDLMVSQAVPRSKSSATSRAVRMENACEMLRAAAEALRAWQEAALEELTALENQLAARAGEEISYIQKRGGFALRTSYVSIIDWLNDEVNSIIDSMEEALSEMEGCEFPGMFG